MQNENNTELTIIENEIKKNEIQKFIDIIELQPAIISFDFELLNNMLKNVILPLNIHFDENNNIDNTKTKFDVDWKNLKISKKIYQSLNTIEKNINATMKAKIEKVIAPVDIFKKNCKKIYLLIDNAVSYIQKQTKAHEEQLKMVCKELLLRELNRLCLLHKLDTEYQDKIDISDLANLTNLNAEYEEAYITKKAKESVEAKVNKMLLLQNRVKNRLLSLKDVCLTAGLITPLTKEDILHIIESEDDDMYNQAINSLITKELNKQNAIAKAIEVKKAEPVVNVEPKTEISTPIKANNGKIKYYITATFELETDIPKDKVEINFKNKLSTIFSNSFKNLTIKTL
jgi:hypothetical protein